MIRERHRERLRQHHERSFARVIGAGIHLALKAIRRRRDHDAAATLFGHETLRKGLRREKGRREIELHRLVPTLASHFEERQVEKAACVADQACRGRVRGRKPPPRAVAGHRSPSGRPSHNSESPSTAVGKTVKHDLGTQLPASLAHRQADALRGAGHERGMAFKRECFHRRA
jgi:hypothetical protein